MKQIVLLSVLLSFICVCASAQRELRSIGIETDPFSTVLGARTISCVIEPPKVKKWSLFLNVSKASFSDKIDDFLNPKNKENGLGTQIKWGSGFGIDYFKKENRDGVYFGVINLFFRS